VRALRSSEDVLVDDLFAAAPSHGAPLLRAHFPRSVTDVNREAYELDSKLFNETPPAFANTRSLRVAAGLGVIPRVVAEGQAIYAERIALAEGLRRIENDYKPYHAMLEGLMTRAMQTYGVAVLIDCHSMPSRMPTGDVRRPYEPLDVDIVIGDRYGASCDPAFSHRVHKLLTEFGYRVARNKPYAGGFITETYANRAKNRHALQIEINRGLYLDEKSLEPKPAYAQVKADIERLIAEIAPARDFLGANWREAAE
jgi:N-formylglutamate amidohydrolase